MATLPSGPHTLRALYADLLGCALMPDAPYTGEPLSPLLPPIAIPKPASLMPIYAAISLGALLIGGAAAVLISLIRPSPADNTTLISTVMTGLGVGTLQLLNFIKSSQAVAVGVQTTEQVGVLHKSVNSGFEEFARLIRAEAHAAGVKESEEKQTDSAAIEARITAAVDAAVAKTLLVATQPGVAPGPTADVAPVDVQQIRPDAAKAIADAVKPEAVKGTLEAIADALPTPKEPT